MYLDSAIIVKLLIQEPDSDEFQSALIGQNLDTAELSVLEVASALCGKERQGHISRRLRERALTAFDEKLESDEIRLLPVTSPTFLRARRFLEACHPHVALRSLDALHLATCDQHDALPFCTTDVRLRTAVGRLGLPIFPSTLS